MSANEVVEGGGSEGQTSQHFQRILPENCLEYTLFYIETEATARNILSGLESVRKAATQLSKQLTKDYIWQRDGFALEIKNEAGMIRPYLICLGQLALPIVLTFATRAQLSTWHNRLWRLH